MEILKAIRSNDYKKVEKRLKKGFIINQEVEEYDKKELICRTIPICAAAAHGHSEIVELLLAHGADINAWNKDWSSPMHIATYHGHINVMHVLLFQNVNLSNQDMYGNSVLHIAVQQSNFEAFQLLMHHNIDIKIINKMKKTALDISIEENDTKMIQILREEHEKISTPQIEKKIPEKNNVQENEKDRLKRQLQEIELKEMNDLIEEKQQKLATVKNDIKKFNDKSIKLKAEMSAIEHKIAANNQSLLCNQSLKTVLENDLKKLEMQKLDTKKIGFDKDNKPIKKDSFECPICFELPLPPTKVYQCTNGHVFCGVCKDKPLMENCPQCRIPLNNASRNIVFEEIIQNIFT